MNSFGLLVLWAICAIVVNRLYHKLFAVFYFSFGAVLRELIFYNWHFRHSDCRNSHSYLLIR